MRTEIDVKFEAYKDQLTSGGNFNVQRLDLHRMSFEAGFEARDEEVKHFCKSTEDLTFAMIAKEKELAEMRKDLDWISETILLYPASAIHLLDSVKVKSIRAKYFSMGKE